MLGLALAEAEGAALASALHLAHEVDPHADQQQHRAPADQNAHQDGRLLTRPHVELDAVGDEVTDQAAIKVGGGAAQTLVVGRGGDDLGAAARAFLQRDRLDALAAHFFEEVGIADLVARRHAPVKLLEDGEQHKGYHQPDCDFREPLIVHRGSFSQIQRYGAPKGSHRIPRYMGLILVQTRHLPGLAAGTGPMGKVPSLLDFSGLRQYLMAPSDPRR
jgi:hypothetical protein